MSKKVRLVIRSESGSIEEVIYPKVGDSDAKHLPPLYAKDSNGKLRVWKCWVVGDTVHREHGLVDGKHVLSSRIFEGKNVGKKNETTPEEQAWNEANKEWIAHIDKEYAPDGKDKEGNNMMRKLKVEKEKTGGHNINSVATTTAARKNNTNGATVKTTKTVSRKKTDTCMVDEVMGGAVIPMKAESWELADESDPYSVLPKVSKYFHTVTGKGKNMTMEPADYYIQPKLDGWRCRIALQRSDSGVLEIVMTSNSGKQYPWFASLRECFKKWLTLKFLNPADCLDGLDGELYAQEFTNVDGKIMDPLVRFSTVCSICALARSVPHELEDQIQFHCFDLLDRTGTISQKERFERLDRLFKRLPKEVENRIIRVETKVLSTVDEVVDAHNEYESQGYEGIILRTFDMKYKVGKRSAEMRKFKYFKDEEYEIIGCQVDKGVSKEHFVWLLKTEEGNEFSAKPVGTREQKFEWYKNQSSYIGKFLTVKFQEKTEENIPRFPIAKHFRSAKGID